MTTQTITVSQNPYLKGALFCFALVTLISSLQAQSPQKTIREPAEPQPFQDFAKLPEELPSPRIAPDEPRAGVSDPVGTPHLTIPVPSDTRPTSARAGGSIVPERGGGAKPDLPRRAVIRLRLKPVTEDVRRRTGLPTMAGGWVIGRIADGPAAAGVPIDSVVVSMDGKAVNTPDDVFRIVAASPPGKQVEVTYYLQRTPETILVTLGEAVTETSATAGSRAAPLNAGRLLPLRQRIAARLPGLIESLNDGGPNSPINQLLNSVGSGGRPEDRETIDALQHRVDALEQRLKQLEGNSSIPGAAAPTEPDRTSPAPVPQPPRAEILKSIVVPPPPAPLP